MKILITILGIINGGFMLLDGIYVLLKGKYIGPEKPGPWATIFYKFDIDVFKLGPLFIIYGVMWLLFIIGLRTNQSWALMTGLLVSLLTLWYVPIGTIISLIILVLLLTARKKLGI